MQRDLTITFAPPPGSPAPPPRDLLLLEQEPWQPYVGAVTKGELVQWVASVIYGEAYQSAIDCGLQGGALVCAVNAYPLEPGLSYSLHTSWGTLSERAEAIEEETELVEVRLEDTARPRYPARSITAAAWQGEVYDATGAVVAGPAVTLAADGLQLAAAVYGTLLVTYTTERHRYILTAPRRDDAVEDHFSAVVYGRYPGGISWLEIEEPPGIEAFEADGDILCGMTWTGTVDWPDDPDDPVEGRRRDIHRVRDYCTQQLLSETDHVY